MDRGPIERAMARQKRRGRWRTFLKLGGIAAVVAGLPLILLLICGHGARDYQSCANCRSQIRAPFRDYAEAHDGWLPGGGKDEWDSLAKCVQNGGDAGCFTSHALRGKASRYWEKTGSLCDEVCCYRYNEGLRADDPDGLIVMYYESPTHWECSSHHMDELGRPCMLTQGLVRDWSWEWLPEEKFQAEQARTLAFIGARKARLPDIERARSALALRVAHTSPSPDAYRFEFGLENRSDKAMKVTVLESLTVTQNGCGGPGLGEAKEVVLGPGAAYVSPEHMTTEVRDQYQSRRLKQRDIRTTERHGSSSGRSTFDGQVDLSEVNEGYWVQLRARVRVDMEGMAEVELAIASPRDMYLVSRKAP